MREGIVVTRDLVSLGTELVINAKCAPGGYIRVEIADRRDNIVGNCTRENCDVFSGDSVVHTVTWQGKPNIPAGGISEEIYWRKIRFFIKDAELFSFRFAGKEVSDGTNCPDTGITSDDAPSQSGN